MGPQDAPTAGPPRPKPLLTVTIRLNRRVYCPVCGSELQGECTAYRDSIAVCGRDYGCISSLWNQIKYCRSDPDLAPWWVRSCGLAHWSPTDSPHTDLLAFRRHLYERCYGRVPTLHATPAALPA
jgi:hypothetical protein